MGIMSNIILIDNIEYNSLFYDNVVLIIEPVIDILLVRIKIDERQLIISMIHFSQKFLNEISYVSGHESSNDWYSYYLIWVYSKLNS